MSDSEESSEEEEEIIGDNYVPVKDLGRGMYGEVRLCEHVQTKDRVAVKIMNKRALKRMRNYNRSEDGKMVITTGVDKVMREIAIMKKMSSPFTVKLIEVIDDEDTGNFILVLEFVEGGELMSWDGSKLVWHSKHCDATAPDDGRGVFSEGVARGFFCDLLLGLHYIHSNGVLHSDLKPENLLINDGHIKLADFGVSQVFEDKDDMITRTDGTPAFLSPEAVSEGAFSGTAADIWAAGVTLYCMTYGKAPFWADNIEELYTSIKTQDLTFPFPVGDGGLEDLLTGMLIKDPTARLDMKAIMSHPWVVAAGVEMPTTFDVTPAEPTQAELDGAVTTMRKNFALVAKIKVVMAARLKKARDTLAAGSSGATAPTDGAAAAGAGSQ